MIRLCNLNPSLQTCKSCNRSFLKFWFSVSQPTVCSWWTWSSSHVPRGGFCGGFFHSTSFHLSEMLVMTLLIKSGVEMHFFSALLLLVYGIDYPVGECICRNLLLYKLVWYYEKEYEGLEAVYLLGYKWCIKQMPFNYLWPFDINWNTYKCTP